MYIQCMLSYRFFYIKCLHLTGNLRSGTVDGQIIQTLDNFIPRAPPNFKVVFFFQGLRRVDKTNQTPQHDIKRTRSLTLTFGEGGVVQSFPRGLNILSIYGTTPLNGQSTSACTTNIDLVRPLIHLQCHETKVQITSVLHTCLVEAFLQQNHCTPSPELL